MPDNNSNPKATITNNSGVDVEIFDVYNSLGDSKAKLTYTSLGKIKPGETQDIQTLHFASQLQAMYTGAIPALNNNYYYQFPIAVFVISKLRKVTNYTIYVDDKTGMEQAFQLIKYSTANADSKIAQDFKTALSDKDQKMAVDNFFAKTANFSKCNLAKWTAVFSWQAQFTSAWQGPYYLYNVPQTKDGSDIKLIAVVNITSTADADKAILLIANADGQVSAQSQAITLEMAGDGTLSESNVGAGNLSVNLQPTWINVVQSSSDGKMNYLIGSVLSGTINGIKVIGTQQSRDLPASKNPGKTDKDKTAIAEDWAKTFSTFLSPLASLAGLIISAGMLYYMAKGHKESQTQKKNNAENKAERDSSVTEEDVRQEQDQIDSEYENTVSSELQTEVQAKQADVTKLKAAHLDVVNAQKKATLENMAERQVEKLEEVLETKPPTDKLETTVESLANAQESIETGDFDAAQTQVDQAKQDVDTALAQDAGTMQDYEMDALKNTRDAMKSQAEQSQELEDAQTEKSKELEQESSDELSEETFKEAESDRIEVAPVEVGGL
jgi:hypothetical protein